ncbi:LacI family transcriptional regulator [Paenibacillus sp. UNCCL117]|uniref:LacI family DNA-binding transcriptional regulator n=1 Tax=unclassified Paenibacillus TaxID=185978 RepID=UPI00088E969A|nr:MULTISPECIES: LacI family DNA-binding transcriptional regulator [unclassified Paenibacillus]SDD69681.1 transcriptional regulator, LacI family [Paenibacillus sp. cl123]SFW45188.1 LacI family transcriptional regulator [Paenibacillus sp. UNCCL117]
MRRKRVTLQHLADRLGLTIQTVSKALRGHPGMSEQTRSEVIRLARELGYWTKEQQQSFSFDRIAPFPVMQRRFVLVQTEGSLNFNRLLLEGLHERFMEFGHRVQPLLVPSGLTGEAFHEWAEARELHYADGLFIAPRMGQGDVEERLLEMKVPRMLLNFPPPEAKVDSVIWDVYEAMHQAVRHLLRLGHRRLLYVGSTAGQRGFALRWQAFCEAMGEAGLSADPAEHCTQRPAGRRWLDDFAALYASRRPSAVICGIDEETRGVYDELLRLGIDVPRECSLVAFLNEQTPELPVCSRPLLLIRATGYRAADRMLWRIANPQLPYEHIRLRGDFIGGSTTGPPTG